MRYHLRNEQLLKKLDRLRGRIGRTPLSPLDHPAVDLHVKLEYTNIMGSVKDRAAYAMIRGAVEKNLIHAGSKIIEASSGNFAVSCAGIAKMVGLDFVAVIDPGINAVYERMIRDFAFDVIKVNEKGGHESYLQSKLEAVHDYCRACPGAFWTNQYGNPNNFDAHYNGTGAEIAEALDHLDYAFVAVATGGTIAGISHRLKGRFPGVKIIAVDAEGSVIFGGRPKPRHIPGMGSGMVPMMISRALIDDVVTVPERETIRACHKLFYEHGLFLGGSSGTCYAAVNAYFGTAPRKDKPRVVFLSPDRGHGYIDNLYNDAWLAWFADQDRGKAPAGLTADDAEARIEPG